MNATTTSVYPFYSYEPSTFGAVILGVFVYVSLIIWFVQSLHTKCRPTMLCILIFVAHLGVFIELVIRGTLHAELLRTKLLFQITAPLCNVPPRMILFANYHCLVALRGKKPHRAIDRAIDIIVPLVAITGDILIAVAEHFAFKPHRYALSFYFRQASAAFILALAVFFYFVWHIAVPHARRLFVLPLLTISSTCVLIQSIYMQIIAFPSMFAALTQRELCFYVGHVVPLVLALCTWSIYHPRRVLPPPERDVPHDAAGRELLPTPSLI